MLAATLLLALGGLISLVALVLEWRRSRRTAPYEGMRRVPPEIHFAASLLSAVGAGLAWGWLAAGAIFVGQAAITVFVAVKLAS